MLRDVVAVKEQDEDDGSYTDEIFVKLVWKYRKLECRIVSDRESEWVDGTFEEEMMG